MTTNVLWFTARGAGLSALLVLSLAAALGASGATRWLSPAGRVVAQYLHRTAAITGLLLILVHLSTLVLDSKAHVGLAGALIPFASHYRPNAVALGSIAMYCFVLISALALARGMLARSGAAARSWRPIHLLSYPAWAMAVLHGMLAGTDRSQRWVVYLVIGCVAMVGVAALSRLGRIDEQPRDAAGRFGSRPRVGAGR